MSVLRKLVPAPMLSVTLLVLWLLLARSLSAGHVLLGSVLALVVPASLSRLNRAWARFGLLLSRIVSPVAMLAIFALGVVPVGLIRRALGHDPLRLRRDPAAASYWIERVPPGPPPETLVNQF